jgi:hypothetical protein
MANDKFRVADRAEVGRSVHPRVFRDIDVGRQLVLFSVCRVHPGLANHFDSEELMPLRNSASSASGTLT